MKIRQAKNILERDCLGAAYRFGTLSVLSLTEWACLLATLVLTVSFCVECLRLRTAEIKLYRRIDVLSKVERGENLTFEEMLIQHNENGDTHYCEPIRKVCW